MLFKNIMIMIAETSLVSYLLGTFGGKILIE